jgi:hypothetical protein
MVFAFSSFAETSGPADETILGFFRHPVCAVPHHGS